MNTAVLRDCLFAGGVVLLQLLVFRHLRFYGAEPDFVLVYIIWMMATRDRTTALYHAAGMGLVLDFFLDLWGIHLLSKVLTVFLIYHFVPRTEESKLLFTQVFFIIFLVSLFHNLLFLGASLFAGIRVELIFWQHWIGNAVFTSILGSFIYLFKTN